MTTIHPNKELFTNRFGRIPESIDKESELNTYTSVSDNQEPLNDRQLVLRNNESSNNRQIVVRNNGIVCVQDRNTKYLNHCKNLLNGNDGFQKCNKTSELTTLDKRNKLFFHTVPKKDGNSIIIFKFNNTECVVLGRYFNNRFDETYSIDVLSNNPFRYITKQHYNELNKTKTDYNVYVFRYTYFIDDR